MVIERVEGHLARKEAHELAGRLVEKVAATKEGHRRLEVSVVVIEGGH